MASPTSQPRVDNWLEILKSHTTINRYDDPNYFASTPHTLITTSKPIKFSVGTGCEIFQDVLTACASANHEVIIVSCFWAKSESQQSIYSLLRRLSDDSCAQNR